MADGSHGESLDQPLADWLDAYRGSSEPVDVDLRSIVLRDLAECELGGDALEAELRRIGLLRFVGREAARKRIKALRRAMARPFLIGRTGSEGAPPADVVEEEAADSSSGSDDDSDDDEPRVQHFDHDWRVATPATAKHTSDDSAEDQPAQRPEMERSPRASVAGGSKATTGVGAGAPVQNQASKRQESTEDAAAPKPPKKAWHESLTAAQKPAASSAAPAAPAAAAASPVKLRTGQSMSALSGQQSGLRRRNCARSECKC